MLYCSKRSVMKTVLCSIIFLMSSVSQAAYSKAPYTRLNETIKMAEASLNKGDLDQFSIIAEVAVEYLNSTKVSYERAKGVSEIKSLIALAKSSMDPNSFQRLENKARKL